MTQIAAERSACRSSDVTFKLGDSSLPEVARRGRLVHGGLGRLGGQGRLRRGREEAARAAPGKVDDSPLAEADARRRDFADGRIRLAGDPSAAVSIAEAMQAGGVDVIEDEERPRPNRAQAATRTPRYTHSAVFAEVKVDEDFGTVRVTRVVSAVAGRPDPQPEDGPQPDPGRRRHGASAWRSRRRACSTTGSAGS